MDLDHEDRCTIDGVGIGLDAAARLLEMEMDETARKLAVKIRSLDARSIYEAAVRD